MKKLLVMLVALFVAGSAQAWKPTGWAWFSWPYAYDHQSEDWYWFNTANTQWTVGPLPGGTWQKMGATPLVAGWTYISWPYAYDWEGGRWYYMNEGDRQWCVNLSTGEWSLFGRLSTQPPIPAGMVLIPGGTNAGTDPDFGAYSLTVTSFYMDRYEVTKALWDEVYAWAIANGYSFENVGSGKASNHPVHTVNWYDVVKWCNARSQKEGRPAVYTVGGAVYKTGMSTDVVQTSAAGYRLPTDLEWEYAARGGVSSRRFPWGDSDEIQHARANYSSHSSYSYDTSPTREYHPDSGVSPRTMAVGSFAANGYGLYEMAGNVWEWCFDWYPGFEGTHRVVRGGSWYNHAYYCLVGRHLHYPLVNAFHAVGFRAVLPPGQ